MGQDPPCGTRSTKVHSLVDHTADGGASDDLFSWGSLTPSCINGASSKERWMECKEGCVS